MSDGRRPIWATREGVVLIVVAIIVAVALIWHGNNWVNEAMTPQPPAKKTPSQQPKQTRPEPVPPNPPIDLGNP
jgi:hypothetical protein